MQQFNAMYEVGSYARTYTIPIQNPESDEGKGEMREARTGTEEKNETNIWEYTRWRRTTKSC